MIIKSAKISNFKSITNEHNVLPVEDTITALIGKNESGKSNVLQSLGLLKPWSPLDNNYKKFMTRGQNEPPLLSILLSFTNKETKLYPNAKEDTIIYYDYSDVKIEGGLSVLISKDTTLSSAIETLHSIATSNELKLGTTNANAFRTYSNKLKNIHLKIYSNIFSELNSIKEFIVNSSAESRDKYAELVDVVKNKLRNYYNLIPQVYYRSSDSVLKDTYTFDEIKKLFGNDNLFNSLMVAANINKDTLFGAFQNVNDGALKTSRKSIQNGINEVVKKFNEFYTQEPIALDFDVEGQTARLFINTLDKYMSFSERSNGLKWYFSLFIDTEAKINKNRPILYLLDEPGVYLHVKAQKELLQYFNRLCNDGNQVIYTTHSPFMINNNNVYNVRAVEKDKNGNSNIHKSIYSHQLSEKSKLETLSPLIEAFGMDLKDNIGPQYIKNNIIVEGVTDNMYLTAMMKYFNISEENQPNIIPCAGVNNVNLVASILIGWGCNFKIVLDHDPQGFSEYKVITQKTSLLDDNIVFFVNLKKPEKEKDVKGENSATTESLISNEDNEKLFNKYDGTKSTKPLAAKEFLDRVSNGEIIPSVKTCENFKKLFVALGLNVE